jgi:hypothetical protein
MVAGTGVVDAHYGDGHLFWPLTEDLEKRKKEETKAGSLDMIEMMKWTLRTPKKEWVEGKPEEAIHTLLVCV